MTEENELEALGSQIRRLRTVKSEQSRALVEVHKTEVERLRQQIRLLEASVPVEARENAELRAKVEQLRGFYENHNAVVAKLNELSKATTPVSQDVTNACAPGGRNSRH
jgi:predicted RNase H-like nuclease (RuvC/YqgF family)